MVEDEIIKKYNINFSGLLRTKEKKKLIFKLNDSGNLDNFIIFLLKKIILNFLLRLLSDHYAKNLAQFMGLYL